jgi:hypothetical protein
MHTAPFDAVEQDRLAATFARLLPHADRLAIALTGGVAIQLHCHDARIASGRIAVADVDFVAASVHAISPSVSDNLLVSHFHLPHGGYPKFMVQLVDPDTRLRVDVFPDLAGSIARASERWVCGHRLLVLDAQSILDHKALGLARASVATPIDGKHARDAQLLASLCGRRIDPPPHEAITSDRYGIDLTPCPRCEASRTRRVIVAPRQRIVEILGYT